MQCWETHLRSFEINGLITHKCWYVRRPICRELFNLITLRDTCHRKVNNDKGATKGDSISRKIIFYCILYLSIVCKSRDDKIVLACIHNKKMKKLLKSCLIIVSSWG